MHGLDFGRFRSGPSKGVRYPDSVVDDTVVPYNRRDMEAREYADCQVKNPSAVTARTRNGTAATSGVVRRLGGSP